MDKSLLVKSGHSLIDALIQQGMKLRAVMWVYNDELENWKLWIVPEGESVDKHDFYGSVLPEC